VARGARHGGGELIVRKGMKDMWAPGGPFQPTGPKEDWAESNEKERKGKSGQAARAIGPNSRRETPGCRI
jgi:hypothetical protein